MKGEFCKRREVEEVFESTKLLLYVTFTFCAFAFTPIWYLVCFGTGTIHLKRGGDVGGPIYLDSNEKLMPLD
jgi:hypothetical protein